MPGWLYHFGFGNGVEFSLTTMNSTEYFFLFLGFRSVRRHIPLGRTSVLFHICRTRFVAVYSCLRRRILLARRSQLLRNPHEILRVFRWLAFLHKSLSVGVVSRRRSFPVWLSRCQCNPSRLNPPLLRGGWYFSCSVLFLGEKLSLSTNFAGFSPRWALLTARFEFSSTVTAGFAWCIMLSYLRVVLSTCFDLFRPSLFFGLFILTLWTSSTRVFSPMDLICKFEASWLR